MAENSSKSTETSDGFAFFGKSLYPIAVASLIQGGCFLAAAMLRNRVSFIPKDPVVLIGTVYGLTGVDFLLSSCYIKYRTASQKPEKSA